MSANVSNAWTALYHFFIATSEVAAIIPTPSISCATFCAPNLSSASVETNDRPWQNCGDVIWRLHSSTRQTIHHIRLNLWF
uniref:Secreted protein n=1 Tax=Phytophthora fragariae TaxID=53985 RepID=A0A6A3E916_9STRA|nr:hypothetical protein PF009_g21105 [Phytophthora fragariae]